MCNKYAICNTKYYNSCIYASSYLHLDYFRQNKTITREIKIPEIYVNPIKMLCLCSITYTKN